MTASKTVQVPERKMREWIAAFRSDPALHTLFPVTLMNGKLLPGMHVVCSNCGNSISGDRVHGRTVQSLPHVLTVSASGYCAECDRLTHIDCRIRANASDTIVEWLGTNGNWQARELRQPTFAEKVRRWLRRLAVGSAPAP